MTPEALRPLLHSLPAQAAPHHGADQAFIPWAYQGALLAEFARSRGLDPQDWLLPCGVRPGQLLSPRQLLTLLAALQAALGAPAKDLGFVLGQLSLPGHYGLASQALQQAADLEQALQLLCHYPARLSPLLTPRLLRTDAELLLVWTEACGAPPSLQPLLVDMQMSAVVAMAQWLSGGQRLPWQFSFNRTRPRELAQHAAYLGGNLQFGCQVDAMRLPLALARQPWPAAARPGPSMALGALQQGADPEALWRGQLAALYDHLLPRVAAQPTLEQSAQVFGVSPATLKRQLAQLGTHHQAQLDQVRAHAALYLLGLRGQRSEAVARSLGFHDKSNFRRSFKRWTGLTPGAL